MITKTKPPTSRAVSDARYGKTHRAKCPKCGKVGIRSLAPTKRGEPPRCYIFGHGRIPSFMPGVFQAVQCFVPCNADGSYALPNDHGQTRSPNTGEARASDQHPKT